MLRHGMSNQYKRMLLQELLIDLWCVQEHHLGEQATKFLSGKLRKKNYKVHAIPAKQVHNPDYPDILNNTGGLIIIASSQTYMERDMALARLLNSCFRYLLD